jgi:hypothetical protein
LVVPLSLSALVTRPFVKPAYTANNTVYLLPPLQVYLMPYTSLRGIAYPGINLKVPHRVLFLPSVVPLLPKNIMLALYSSIMPADFFILLYILLPAVRKP